VAAQAKAAPLRRHSEKIVLAHQSRTEACGISSSWVGVQKTPNLNVVYLEVSVVRRYALALRFKGTDEPCTVYRQLADVFAEIKVDSKSWAVNAYETLLSV
jgi:hypothetical protein